MPARTTLSLALELTLKISHRPSTHLCFGAGKMHAEIESLECAALVGLLDFSLSVVAAWQHSTRVPTAANTSPPPVCPLHQPSLRHSLAGQTKDEVATSSARLKNTSSWLQWARAPNPPHTQCAWPQSVCAVCELCGVINLENLRICPFRTQKLESPFVSSWFQLFETSFRKLSCGCVCEWPARGWAALGVEPRL